MADILQFDYDLLQSFIDNFTTCHNTMETCKSSLAPMIAEINDLSTHHLFTVRSNEESIYTDQSQVFSVAKDGSQETYDAFKAADQAGGQG